MTKKSSLLSVFDLDHTLLTINSSFSYYNFLRKFKVFSFSSFFFSFSFLISHLYFKMSPMELHERVFKKFLKDRPAKELIDKVELFWNFHLEHLYQPAVDILRRAQKEGQTVLILSNSPDFLVGPIAKKLGIEMWQATKYEIDEKGNFCNILKVMDGLEKARFTLDLAKRLNIFKKNITVYTDSIWDLPLLNVAGTKVAVNPDRKLLTLSKKENWSVI